MNTKTQTYDFEIITGSYEEFLLGYLVSIEDGEIKQSFASHDHTGSVRALARSGKYLASGGSDDRIIIYDLNTRKECNMLVHHEATITALQFTNDHSHLISGSADGVLAITRVGSWLVEKKWEKAHKGAAILDVALHESGKLALTLGADSTLRTWNLVKGRQAYAINLNSKSKDPKSLERILWGPNSVNFILHGGKFVEIWDINEGGMTQFFEFSEKVICCAWMSSKKIAVGHENGEISIVKLKTGSKTTQKIHETRVKSMQMYENYLVTISSDGEFKVLSPKFEELLKENTGCRLTCLSVIPTFKVKTEKEDEDVDEEVDSEIHVKTVNSKPRVIVTHETSEIDNGDSPPKPKKKRKNK